MRLFVAVWPPPDVIEHLAALPRPAFPGVRWTTQEQWHITLMFLGEVGDAGNVTASLGPSLPASTVRLGPLSELLGREVLALPAAGLDLTAAAVRAALAGVGRQETRPFRGHLTLARAGRRSPRGVLRGALPMGVTATWAVDQVTVVASQLRRDGARYEIVGTVATR